MVMGLSRSLRSFSTGLTGVSLSDAAGAIGANAGQRASTAPTANIRQQVGILRMGSTPRSGGAAAAPEASRDYGETRKVAVFRRLDLVQLQPTFSRLFAQENGVPWSSHIIDVSKAHEIEAGHVGQHLNGSVCRYTEEFRRHFRLDRLDGLGVENHGAF